MKILYSFIFAFLIVTVWTAAIPTPRSNQLAYQPEAREYYGLDDFRIRSVEQEGGLGLVSRKIHIHISQRVKNAFSKIKHFFQKAGKVALSFFS